MIDYDSAVRGDCEIYPDLTQKMFCGKLQALLAEAKKCLQPILIGLQVLAAHRPLFPDDASVPAQHAKEHVRAIQSARRGIFVNARWLLISASATRASNAHEKCMKRIPELSPRPCRQGTLLSHRGSLMIRQRKS